MSDIHPVFQNKINEIQTRIESIEKWLSIRGTGKTTKMLNNVLDTTLECKWGDNICVFTSNGGVAKYLLDRMTDICNKKDVQIVKRGLALIINGVNVYFKDINFIMDSVYTTYDMKHEFFDNSVELMRWERMLAKERESLDRIKKEIFF
jgi:hypothetical protein